MARIALKGQADLISIWSPGITEKDEKKVKVKLRFSAPIAGIAEIVQT